MKLAFISDIHGNAVALEAVLKDLRAREIDEVFVLGDICFRGPQPRRSLEMVRTLDTEVIKGNADEWIVRGVEKGEVPDEALAMMNAERDWAASQLDHNDIAYLRDLPTELNLAFGDLDVHAFHATPNSLFDAIQPDASDDTLTKQMMKENANIYIYAHIHKPYIRYINGKCVINTGSVGLPFDGSNQSSYAIIEILGDNVRTSIAKVSYDVDQVVNQFEESDYPNIKFMTELLKSKE